MGKGARIRRDRAGDTSANSFVSANSPAILFSTARDIEHLQEMGIDCAPVDATEYLLASSTFYRLNAYAWFVLEHPRGAKPTIKSLHDIMTFDRRMSATALKYIGVFESRFRSIYSRLMEENLGEFAIYDENNFLRSDKYALTKKSYDREIKRNLRNYTLKREFKKNNGKIPLRIAVEFLSLGCISKLYANTLDNSITNGCAVEFNLNKAKFSSWLKTLTEVRNCCAHFNPYIVKRQIPSTPMPLANDVEASKHPFYIFIMLEHLLDKGGLEKFDDPNIAFSKRIRSDVRVNVSQFLALYRFSNGVASSLYIPERYLPDCKMINGIMNYELYETKSRYVYPISKPESKDAGL